MLTINKKDMKLEGKISILIGREGTRIEIKDEKANITFVKVRLTPKQLSAALSRQVYVDCELEVRVLEKVGKKHENKTFEFELPEGYNKYKDGTEILQEIAQSKLTDGWIAEGYFDSQNSFFKKDGKNYARCIIRRWV